MWADTAAAYDRTVATGARARLESTVGLLREPRRDRRRGPRGGARHRARPPSRRPRSWAIPSLTARVIGAYDVPAIWTRSDDPAQAAAIVAAAERTLPRVPHEAARARLLATIALESRGTRGPASARRHEAERIARRLDDPTLLAFALNGVFMQSCHVTGNAPTRDAIGQELVELSRAPRPRHVRDPRPPDPHPGPQRTRRLRHRRRPRRSRRRAQGQARAAVGRRLHAVVPGAPTGGDRRRRGARLPRRRQHHSTAPACRASTTASSASRCSRWASAARTSAPTRPGRDRSPHNDPPPDLLQEALWCHIADVAIAAGDAAHHAARAPAPRPRRGRARRGQRARHVRPRPRPPRRARDLVKLRSTTRRARRRRRPTRRRHCRSW